MKTIVSLTNPIEITDAQGNKYTIQDLAGNISIQSGNVYFQPTMHQARESITQVARDNADSAGVSYQDPFVLSMNDVEEDTELSGLMDQVETRVASILKDKLDSI